MCNFYDQQGNGSESSWINPKNSKTRMNALMDAGKSDKKNGSDKEKGPLNKKILAMVHASDASLSWDTIMINTGTTSHITPFNFMVPNAKT